MKIDSIQDGSRVVVGEVRHGGILPNNRAEMWRDIFLLPGAHVRGSIWGNAVQVNGPAVQVDEAVYARGAIRVSQADDGEGKGDVTFHSAVTSPDSVVVDDVPFRVRFLSSIYSGVVNLNHAIVYGNIYARTVTIRNSVVLGGVYCKGGLKLDNCAISTFRSRSAEVGPGVRLFFPLAMAEQAIRFEHPVKALPFYDLAGSGGDGSSGGVTLDSRDVYLVHRPTAEKPEGEPLHVLSMNERVLDTEKLLGQFHKNRDFLECLSLGRHLDPEARNVMERETKVNLEDRVMSLLEQDDVPEVAGNTHIEDLFVRPSVLSVLSELAPQQISDRLAGRKKRTV